MTLFIFCFVVVFLGKCKGNNVLNHYVFIGSKTFFTWGYIDNAGYLSGKTEQIRKRKSAVISGFQVTNSAESDLNHLRFRFDQR